MNSFLISLKKNKTGIALILIAALLTSIGQLLWKLSNGSELTLLLIGFICYGMAAIFMIVAFKFGSLSVLHPMLSLSYIFAILLGSYFLDEVVSPKQYIALCIIILGVILIGGGDD